MKASNQKVCVEINKHHKSFLYDSAITYKNAVTLIVLAGLLLFVGSSQIIAKSNLSNDKNIITIPIEQKTATFELQELINGSSERLIKGKVIDSESKKPLQGVAILIQNSTVGTVTSKVGEFILKVPDDYTKKKVKLIFSHFENDTKSINFRTNQLSEHYTIELKKSKEK